MGEITKEQIIEKIKEIGVPVNDLYHAKYGNFDYNGGPQLANKKLSVIMDAYHSMIVYTDEEGNSTLYEHVATLEYEGETYLALCDPEADEDAENLEIFILKIEQDENGDDIYTVPDDDISDAVFEELLKLSEEMDDE